MRTLETCRLNALGPEIQFHWLASDLSSLWSLIHDLQLSTRRDRWDLSCSSIPARAAVTALRAGWAARQKAADLSEDSSGLMDRLAPQDSGMDIQGCAVVRWRSCRACSSALRQQQQSW